MKSNICHSLLVGILLATLTTFVFAEGPRLRILTYNIHHGEGTDGKFDLPRLAKIIKAAEPDLVALQEVDRKTRRASGVDQATELGKLTGMHVEFGRSIDLTGGEYGNAILSSEKPIEVKLHTLPQMEPKTEPRTALAVRVKILSDLPELWFVGTHLCHLREPTRVAQAREVNRLFPLDGPLPVILAGDLNASSGSDSYKEFSRQWVDTLPSTKTIDFVMPRQKDPWKLVGAKVIDEPVASDHKPVLVVLEWTGGNP